MIYLTLELLCNNQILYKFLFTFLKIEGLVIYNFPILVLGLTSDRGGTPLVDFFISQYDFGLGRERDFCSFSSPSPLTKESSLYNIFHYVIYICTCMYWYVLVRISMY